MIDPIEQQLRRGMGVVSEANPPADDLADRLIANAEAGRPAVSRLRAGPGHRRWAVPLLAAACVVAVAAVVVTTKLTADDRREQPPAAPVVSSTGPASSAVTSSAASRPATSNPVLLRQAPAATGVPAGFRAESLSFVDARNGWVIGHAPCDSDSTRMCPTLLSTRDQGAAFARVPLPDALGLNRSVVTSGNLIVQYGGDGRGYVLAGENRGPWATADGGKTWTSSGDEGWRWRELIPTPGGGTFRMLDPGLPDVRKSPTVSYAPTGTFDFKALTFEKPLSSDELLLNMVQAGDTVVATSVLLTRTGNQATASGKIRLYPLADVRGGRPETLSATSFCPSGQRPGSNQDLTDGLVGAPDGSLVVFCSNPFAGGKTVETSFRLRPAGGEFGPVRRLPAKPVNGQGFVLPGGALLALGGDQLGLMYPLGEGSPGCSWRRSEDGGSSWSEARELPDGFCFNGRSSREGRAFANVPGLFIGLTGTNRAGKPSGAPAQLRWTTDNGATWFQRALGSA